MFSANVLFGYLAGTSLSEITVDAKIEQFIDHIALHNHTNEYFTFIRSDATLYEVSKLFKIDKRSMKQLCAIFFTENGRSSEEDVYKRQILLLIPVQIY